jgi:hypothetical protein
VTKGQCIVCGGPADIVECWGMCIVGCPCVPRDRAYVIPAGIGEAPLIARTRLPDGIAVIKFTPEEP